MSGGFERTRCGCFECVSCCKRQPGPLVPGDLERIAAHLGETVEQAKAHFVASAGSLVAERNTGRVIRIGSITPRSDGGRCVFLDGQDLCRVHPVAPFGCAYFDMHMDMATALPRALWQAREMADPGYQALRASL